MFDADTVRLCNEIGGYADVPGSADLLFLSDCHLFRKGLETALLDGKVNLECRLLRAERTCVAHQFTNDFSQKTTC